MVFARVLVNTGDTSGLLVVCPTTVVNGARAEGGDALTVTDGGRWGGDTEMDGRTGTGGVATEYCGLTVDAEDGTRRALTGLADTVMGRCGETNAGGGDRDAAEGCMAMPGTYRWRAIAARLAGWIVMGTLGGIPRALRIALYR